MESALEELSAACERAHAEGRSGTRERSILSSMQKQLRKCLEASAATSLATSPSKRAGAASPSPSTSPRQQRQAEACAAPTPAPQTASADVGPRRELLTSADAVNRLAFGARVALVGDPAGPADRVANAGSIARGHVKALTTSLELAAVLLGTGIVPTELVMPRPVIELAKPSGGGAQAFFSKILGGGRDRAERQSPSPAAAEAPVAAEADAAAAGPAAEPPAAPPAVVENVRDALVDAVIAAAPVALGKEVVEKLVFVFIAALLAAAVPRVSRAAVSHVPGGSSSSGGDSDVSGEGPIRFSALAVRGPRLVRVMELLSVAFTHSSLSPMLHEEARNAMQQVIKALSKHTEHEIRAVGEGAATAGGVVAEGDGGALVAAPPVRVPGADLVSILEFCCAVCRTAPLMPTAPPATAGSTGGGQSKAGTAAPSAGEAGSAASATATVVTVSDADVALFTTYPMLLACLGFVLHIVVNGGHMFRKTEHVIQCIRQRVIPAVVRTSISNETDVFRLSLNVLLTCCVTYGPSLVNETSTVFRHVYFRVLESQFTSFAHKAMVIEAFQRYIEEPQNLIALFLNYDCNTRSQSIYEEMIHYLGAMAGLGRAERERAGGGMGDASSVMISIDYDVPEELRRKAMRTLLLVPESNIQWMERFEVSHSDATADDPQSEAPVDRAVEGDGEDDDNPFLQSRTSVTLVPPPTSGAWNGGGVDGGKPVAEGEAAETVGEASEHPSGDTFLQARRYKDAMKKFFYLFNDKGDVGEAIQFLKDSVLFPSPAAAAAEDAAVVAAEIRPPKEGEAGAGEGEKPPPAPTAAAVAEEAASGGVVSGNAAVPSAAEAEEAARIARFLYEHEDWVDKLVLGEYFAKGFNKAQNKLVFEEWIALYDFTGLKLDEALRLFLGGFKLLGEAQIVDRTMELFAGQYCRQNPTVFTSADTAFILSFSICMLNTDAHSSHINNKMTLEGFLRNNKGIAEGNDVDPAILTGIYNRISREEIVLRPSKYVSRGSAAGGAGSGGGAASGKGSGSGRRGKDSGRLSGNVLDSIPILRHFAPLASVITDKVLLPMDVVGENLFGAAQRKREERRQEEFRAALREVTEALRASASMPDSVFVAATSIENALPMWEVTVDIVCRLLANSLLRIFEESEAYISPSLTGQGAGGSGAGGGSSVSAADLPPDYDPVKAYMRETQAYEYFQVLLRGLTNTVRVCCSYGNVGHTETLLEQSFQMTQLTQTVLVSGTAAQRPTVQVVQIIPASRLELLVCFLNLYISHGSSFGVRGWQAGYTALSLVDTLANGTEGLWRRQTTRLMQRSATGGLDAPSSGPGSPGSDGGARAVGKAAGRIPADMWFGVVGDVPGSIAAGGETRRRRSNILNTVRAIPDSAVDLWLERLFDATQYPTHTRLHMANGLVKVCQKELQHGRTFSLTKLFDFVTVCASFSTRLQWRELWANASVVFVEAGTMAQEIASQALDGLRIVAMTYLMREELLNYSFQKEMLKPFEDILMANQDVVVRRRVITIISELIDFRAGHLASGWHVAFTCLSHAAIIPEVVEFAWGVCERAMALHVSHMKDCFSDLVFCLTTFACSDVDEQVPLKGISYLVACGHWLQYGLEPPPPDVRAAADVVRWACRFRSADREARAAKGLGRNLTRVSLAPEPLSPMNLLTKPGSYVAKTHYHLWMSLFEGLIPIVVVHSSVRVRAHAVCSIALLLRHYGSVFSPEVQESLFAGTLRPVLATLISHVQRTGDATADRADYRMLVYLALRSLVLACTENHHLLELWCATMKHLSSSLSWTVEVVENDVVDVWVRICCDALAAVVTHQHGAAGESPFSTDSPPLSSTMGGLASADHSLYNSFHGEPSTPLAAPALSWMPQPLPEKKEANPFFVGLLHEVQQIGSVDVVHLKRSAGWTELHVSVAATTPVVTLAPALRTFSLTSLMQRTVLECLCDGVLDRLLETVARDHADSRERSLLFARAIRNAMLGLSFYCAATKDVEGVCRLLDFVRRVASPASPVAAPSGAGDGAVGGGSAAATGFP